METTLPDIKSGVVPAFEVFNPPSIKFAKRAAQRLQKAVYVVKGQALKLSAAQESLARVYGHKNWFTLSRQVDRDGYSQSQLDSELTALRLEFRRKQHSSELEVLLELTPLGAGEVLRDAHLTSMATEPISRQELSRWYAEQGLPMARPRTGMSEIFLTAYPFSVAGRGIPLPGWNSYVVVAAPTDNTALWVRFCDERDIAVEASHLVKALKELSSGSLATAYVPSQVVRQVPHIADTLAENGIEIRGGRPAIMAGQLRARLDSVMSFTSYNLALGEEVPSNDELRAVLHSPSGLVELPDAKKLRHGAIDLRPCIFGNELMQQIRKQRWPHATKLSHSENARQYKKARRTEIWHEEDGGSKFGSAVRPIAKGAPVYRIRIELPLFDDYSGEERSVTISRVVDVPVHYDLWDLHVAIQDAMGWVDCHLHEFTFYAARSGNKTVTFGSPNELHPEDPISADEELWKHIPALAERPGRYLYDFGDDWEHIVSLIGTFPSDGGGYPRCISGERACPPEDCGSDSGYFRVLDILNGKSRTRQHGGAISRKELVDWLKGHVNVSWPYHPERFDPSNVSFDDPQERWDYAYGGSRYD